MPSSFYGSTLPPQAAPVPTLPYMKEGQCAKTGASGLLMVTAELLDNGTERRLKCFCDGVLELGFHGQGFALYPFLKVTKMRGAPDASQFLLFKETPSGLFMENTRRVF
jgi:hypothetical protein